MEENNKEIIWRAAEYKHFKKSPLWYLVVALVSGLLTLLALLQNNFFFAIFVILAGIMLVFLGKKRPKVVEFRITNNGIEIGNDIAYDYNELEGYTVREYPDRLNEIIIKKDSAINPFIKMPVDSQILPKATSKIEEYIPQKDYEESIIDTFSDILGF